VLLTHSLNFLLPLAIEKVGYVFTCIIRLLQGLIEVAFLTVVSVLFNVFYLSFCLFFLWAKLPE